MHSDCILSALERRHPAPRGVLIDGILSSAVYLVPLITPHLLWPTGAYLLQSLSRMTETPWWVITEWGAVLIVQAILFAVLRLGRRFARVGRTLLAVAGLTASVPALNALLLVAIPLHHLTEASAASEGNHLAEVCHADGVALQPRIGGIHRHLPAAAMLVRREPDSGMALLHVPGCRLQDLEIRADAEIGNTSPSGALLWRTRESAKAGQARWFLTTPAGATLKEPIVLEGPDIPQILDDGRTVGWIDHSRIAVVSDGLIRQIQADVPAGSDLLLEGAGPAGPFHTSISRSGGTHWLTIDAQGRLTSSIAPPPELEQHGHHLRPLQNGWIGWDTYREQGRYEILWNIGERTGRRSLPKGLSVTSIAFDDRGEHIAVSASSGLRIGNQRDEVWLVRTSDGAELFRRYAPKYSRATVAMPTGRFFAVDDSRDGRATVRVYQLRR